MTFYRPRLTFDSFTRPTICSRCGASVFFVEHNGGCAFFNELGWPWEKHDCTGSTLDKIETSTGSSSPRRFLWQLHGWIPIGIEKVFQEDAWFVLKCKRLEDDELVRVVVPNDPGDLRRVPAMLSQWSADAFATLSYLDDDAEPQEIIVGKYSEFCLAEPDAIRFPQKSAASDQPNSLVTLEQI